MPGSTTFFRTTSEDEVTKKPQQNVMGTRQPPPVAPRTTSISLQTWQSSTSSSDSSYGDDSHARSTSMDSLESSGSSSSGGGGTVNNRNTDLGGGEYIPTRTVGKAPKLPSHNPLQFVKVQSPLYRKAEQQIKLTKEVKCTRDSLKEGEEEWQSNLDNWKSRRRKVSEKVIQRAEEMRQIEAEEQLRQEQQLQQQKKIKKFSEIIEKRSSSRSYIDLYIGQGDDSGLGGTPEPDDSVDGQNSLLRSDTSEGMTSEAESIDGDAYKVEKVPDKEPPKVPQKPRLKKDMFSTAYNNNGTSARELFEHCLSKKDLPVSDNISSAEPSDIEGHAGDTETTSSEDDAIYSLQTTNVDSGLESLCESNRRGDLADSASDLSQDSSTGLEKNKLDSTFETPSETEESQRKSCQDHENQDTDNSTHSYKIHVKPGDNKGFGFTLKGGKDQESTPYIDHIVQGGTADVAGLKEGDKIISLNGELTSGHSHASLIFSIKQAVYTGILDIKVNRSENNSLVSSNPEIKARRIKKGSSFAEKLALFSAGTESNILNLDETKLGTTVKTNEPNKRESLVLRRRSTFENGNTDIVTKSHRSSFISQGSSNFGQENIIEKRHSVDFTCSKNIFPETHVGKKLPPPVPVKPKLKSKSFLNENDKNEFENKNFAGKESAPAKSIENSSLSPHNYENSSADIPSYSSSLQFSINKSETEKDEMCIETTLNITSEAETENRVTSPDETVLQECDDSNTENDGQPNICNDISNIAKNLKEILSDIASKEIDCCNLIKETNQNEYLKLSRGSHVDFNEKHENVYGNTESVNFDLSSDTVPNNGAQMAETSSSESDLPINDTNNSEECRPIIAWEKLREAADQSFDPNNGAKMTGTILNESDFPFNDTHTSRENIVTTAWEKLLAATNDSCDPNNEAEMTDTNLDESSLPINETSTSKECTLTWENTETLENDSHDVNYLKNTDDIENQYEENENFIPFENATDSNDITPSPLCLPLEKIDEDDGVSASTSSSGTPDTETVIEGHTSNVSPLPNDESDGEDSTKNCPDIELEEQSVPNGQIYEAADVVEDANLNPLAANVLPNAEEYAEVFDDPSDEAGNYIINEEDNLTYNPYEYEENQDDEYDRELDESIDQITSLDVIDEIEQKLMHQLEKDATYEGIDVDLNAQLEEDISRQWLYFSDEVELLEDLTPRKLEPPREPPPPPPPPESECLENKDLSLVRTNSTKRIKKEIWRRRSDFLGLDSADSIDVDNIPPPPPGLEEILKQEREQNQWLEKRLSIAEAESISYSSEPSSIKPSNFNNDDYNSEYFAEENVNNPETSIADIDSNQWNETLDEETLFDSSYDVQYDSTTTATHCSVTEQNSSKAISSPQNKAKQNIQSLGAAPKAKIMDSNKWITEKTAPVSKKSVEPILRQNSYNQNYWLAQDGERRRNQQYSENRVDRRYSMPVSYTSPRPDVTVRTWGDREYEYQQQRPRSAVWTDAASEREFFESYPPKECEDTLHNLDSHREIDCDTNTLESDMHKCSCCGRGLCEGSAMGIEALRLYFHIECFRCCICDVQLGNGSCGTDVQVKNNQLYCPSCFTVD